MRVEDISKAADALYSNMRQQGCSSKTIGTVQSTIPRFIQYCTNPPNQIEGIEIPIIAAFLSDEYDIDFSKPSDTTQSSRRRALLMLIDFFDTGAYPKHYSIRPDLVIPIEYEKVFEEYRENIDNKGLDAKTKKEKFVWFSLFLKYLSGKGISRTKDITRNHVHEYLHSLTHYASRTRALAATYLREALNWMKQKQFIAFSGHDVLPLIKSGSNRNLLSYYKKEEVLKTLHTIDTNTSFGKGLYFAAVTAALLGLRAGDIIRLRFDNIDWENNIISIFQQKTGSPLILPLLDEVIFALLDYLKNGRHDSPDKEYILITCNAPHTRYRSTVSFSRPLSKCLERAGVDANGRHRGLHSLRQSLATNLTNNNTPLSTISGILGHASIRTTDVYIGLDETHLKELSLEVDDVL